MQGYHGRLFIYSVRINVFFKKNNCVVHFCCTSCQRTYERFSFEKVMQKELKKLSNGNLVAFFRVLCTYC